MHQSAYVRAESTLAVDHRLDFENQKNLFRRFCVLTSPFTQKVLHLHSTKNTEIERVLGQMLYKCRFPAQRKDISFISFVFISCPTTANLREISSPRHSMLKFRPAPKKETRCALMLDQAPCGPAVPCLSRQARAAVMVRLRGEADAGHRSAVSGHRSPVKQVTGQAW